jgi:predicted phosphodiesterase
MRVFALSDLHVDYDVNSRWLKDLSTADYRADVLIVAGDVTHQLQRLGECFEILAGRFRRVLFVPGNHDLWVLAERAAKTSLQKFDEVVRVATASGASLDAFHADGVSIFPLLGWYDYSFGEPDEHLRTVWMDYYACAWPAAFEPEDIAGHFDRLNDRWQRSAAATTVITFSHFLPRIDVMPTSIPPSKRFLYPILGSYRIERQLRRLGADVHVYGHSHVNRRTEIEGVRYINNAFGYPHEERIAAKRLLCIHGS